LAESLTLPQRSEYWALDERDTVLGYSVIFALRLGTKADISTLAKADIFILGRQHSEIQADPVIRRGSRVEQISFEHGIAQPVREIRTIRAALQADAEHVLARRIGWKEPRSVLAGSQRRKRGVAPGAPPQN
jgi:hypothetical protein